MKFQSGRIKVLQKREKREDEFIVRVSLDVMIGI